MKLEHHTVFSVVLSGILYAIFKSRTLAIASLLPGILTDVDHVIDYLIEYGIPFDVKKFFRSCYQGQYSRAYLFLHAWEWFFFGLIVAWLTDWNLWVVGLSIGFGQHMALDQLSNRPRRWGYFLFWRWKNDFKFKQSFPHGGREGF